MRYFLLAILVAIPVVLIGWLVMVGRVAPPIERPPPGGDAELTGLFQGSLGGARLKGDLTLYDAPGLFNYINGAAPIFLERHFRKLAAAELVTQEGAEFTCDVYDMSTPADAESIFLKERSASAQPAQGFTRGITGPMSLVFQQGRYYVKLTAFDEKAEAALPGMGQAIARKIP